MCLLSALQGMFAPWESDLLKGVVFPFLAFLLGLHPLFLVIQQIGPSKK